jgi:hypothetical protein
MTRKIAVASVTLLLALLPGRAVADHGVESVHGGLRSEFQTVPPIEEFSGDLSVSARDSSSGTSGHVQFRILNASNNVSSRFIGEVDCLQVAGNTAVLSGEITQSSGPIEGVVDDRFMVSVVDGSHPEGGATTDSATVSSFSDDSVTDPTTCVTTGFGVFFFFLGVHGNITVHDDI